MSLGEGRLPYGFARRAGLALLSLEGSAARVAMREASAPEGLVELRRSLGRPLEVETLAAAEFERLLSRIYASEISPEEADTLADPGRLEGLLDEMPPAADLLDSQDDAPVIRLINGVIAEAARRGASDVHIEPYETGLVIRFREDGLLRTVLTLSPRLTPMLVSRVKVMARLDIAERRVPQDGRISLSIAGRALDVRVSTLPARGGERVVLRLLDKNAGSLGLSGLGMGHETLSAFTAALAQPNGIVLVTGPTGSGKTTTLYAGLAVLNDETRNILTIEDPVEYAVAGIGQTQVNSRVGMTFAAGLRAILRQDPDVVMVGEIRDPETAQIAVQAALTGHLVLSTVHTNDAVGAVTRLRDMGVEPFLLASTMRMILAQRLVRRLCPHCRVPEPAGDPAARRLGLAPDRTLWRAVGCGQCSHTGYSGRIGVYEAVVVDETIRRLISEGAEEDQIARVAFARTPRLDAAVREALEAGLTSLQEAVRVLRQDRGDDERLSL